MKIFRRLWNWLKQIFGKKVDSSFQLPQKLSHQPLYANNTPQRVMHESGIRFVRYERIDGDIFALVEFDSLNVNGSFIDRMYLPKELVQLRLEILKEFGVAHDITEFMINAWP